MAEIDLTTESLRSIPMFAGLDDMGLWHVSQIATEVKLPRLGQGMESGTIVRWLKAEGDSVKQREPLYELDTDKVTQEVESDLDGVLLQIVVAEGEVEVGSTIAVIGSDADDTAVADGGPDASAPATEPVAEGGDDPQGAESQGSESQGSESQGAEPSAAAPSAEAAAQHEPEADTSEPDAPATAASPTIAIEPARCASISSSRSTDARGSGLTPNFFVGGRRSGLGTSRPTCSNLRAGGS